MGAGVCQLVKSEERNEYSIHYGVKSSEIEPIEKLMIHFLLTVNGNSFID